MAFGGFRSLAWVQSRGEKVTSPDPGRLGSYRKNSISVPSPWAGETHQFEKIAYSEIFKTALPGISREQAMTIPGVQRGRGILLSLIADKPLVAYRGSEPIETQPLWLYRVPGWQGPWRRMANTLDDHIFYGISLWRTVRGYTSSGLAPILQAWHVPFDDWCVDDATGIIHLLDEDMQWRPATDEEVLLIPGPSEGLIATASRTLLGAVELENAWVKRAKNPIPAIELHETIQSGIDSDEAQEIVNDWAAARNDENGMIAYTPYSIEAKVHGQYTSDLFIEGRNASRLDIAAFFQIPGSLLDASTATASLTYVTQEGQASSLDTLTVPYWVRPTEDRLSQDDVVPIGQIVRFAWSQAYTEPPGPIITSPAGHPAIQDAAAVVGDALGEAAVDAATPDTERPTA